MSNLGIITTVIVVGILIFTGCKTLKRPETPYQAGKLAAEIYLGSKNVIPEKVEGMELAYSALETVVDGPEEPVSENLVNAVKELAEKQGYSKDQVDLALNAVGIFREYLRPHIKKSDTVSEVYDVLREFRNGIEDKLDGLRNDQSDT